MSGTAPAGPSREGGLGLIELARTGGLALFAFSCFSPYLLERFTSPSFILVGSVWLYVTARLLQQSAATVRLAIWIALPIVALMAAYALNTLPSVQLAQLNGMPSLLTQYALVLPVAFVGGVTAATDPRLPGFLRMFVALAALNAALALAERVLSRSLLPGNTVPTSFSTSGDSLGTALTEDGAVRGIVASEHPLVLGMLLLAAVPMTFRALPPRRALPVAALLIAGIWSTDSDGPLVLAVAAVLGAVLLRGRSGALDRRTRTLIRLGWPVAVLAFCYAAVAIWTPVVDTFAPVSESTQYRFALYSLIPRVLAAQPLGFGLDGVPSGQLVIERTGRALDASVSVDSELVLLVIQLGAIGALLFVAAATLAIEVAIRGTSPMGGSLLVVTVSGMFLALHVWPSAGSCWLFLVGSGVGALLAGRAHGGSPPRPARIDLSARREPALLP